MKYDALILRLEHRYWAIYCKLIRRRQFQKLGTNSVLYRLRRLVNAARISIGKNTIIEEDATLYVVVTYNNKQYAGEIIIGDNVYINYSVNITATDRIEIGNYTTLAYNVSLLNYNHDFEDPQRHINSADLVSKGPLIIGENCWIGANVVVTGGVRIGDHCVVGANSLVNKNIPDFCVVAGNPARIIKRFNHSSQKWEKA